MKCPLLMSSRCLALLTTLGVICLSLAGTAAEEPPGRPAEAKDVEARKGLSLKNRTTGKTLMALKGVFHSSPPKRMAALSKPGDLLAETLTLHPAERGCFFIQVSCWRLTAFHIPPGPVAPRTTASVVQADPRPIEVRQMWQLVRLEGGWVMIVNKATGAALAASEGRPILLPKPDRFDPAQHWRLD